MFIVKFVARSARTTLPGLIAAPALQAVPDSGYFCIYMRSRAFQFAIRIDSIRYANRFESVRFVKKIGSIH